MPGTTRRALFLRDESIDQSQPSTTQSTTQEGTINNIRDDTAEEGSLASLRKRLPPSIWTVADRKSDPVISNLIVSNKLLNVTEQEKSMQLCGKFLFSTIQRAVQVKDMGEQTFVATGDIDSMWTRDSVRSLFCVSSAFLSYVSLACDPLVYSTCPNFFSLHCKFILFPFQLQNCAP